MHHKKAVCFAVLTSLPLLMAQGCPGVLPGPSVQELNKEVVRQSYERLWNMDDETYFDDLIQIPGYVHHETDKPDVVFTSYEELDAGFDAAQHVTPDVHYTLDRLFAEGDEVIAQWTSTGTFTNNYGSIAATGEVITYHGITIYRLENGKIVESWTEDDDQDILEELLNEDLDHSGIVAGD